MYRATRLVHDDSWTWINWFEMILFRFIQFRKKWCAQSKLLPFIAQPKTTLTTFSPNVNVHRLLSNLIRNRISIECRMAMACDVRNGRQTVRLVYVPFLKKPFRTSKNEWNEWTNFACYPSSFDTTVQSGCAIETTKRIMLAPFPMKMIPLEDSPISVGLWLSYYTFDLSCYVTVLVCTYHKPIPKLEVFQVTFWVIISTQRPSEWIAFCSIWTRRTSCIQKSFFLGAADMMFVMIWNWFIQSQYY